MMDIHALANLIFDAGKENYVEDLEIYIVRNSSMMFNIYEGNLEDYIVAEESVLSLRGMYKGKMGYAYTEKLTEDAVDELISNLIQYAQNNDRIDVEALSERRGALCSQKSESKWCVLSNHTEEEKISYMKAIERQALAMDDRISVVDGCSYEENKRTILIKSTKGLDLEATHSFGVIGLSVVAKEKDDVQTGYARMLIHDLTDQYRDKIVTLAAGDAVCLLGAAALDSGRNEVILRNNVAADLFSYMSPIFLGSMVQRNLSKLKGMLGQQVGTEPLNIVDNPLIGSGKLYRTFDDEGTATYAKHIIEGGVLKTFLHNAMTASADGIESTGNGFRVSHKGSIDVMASNMYIEEGKTSLVDMMRSVHDGILITDIQGLHAGINAVSGDFSLYSSGHLIKDGCVDRPVSQITISGNFFDMLRNISMIGNDMSFCAPEMIYFGSPSLKVGELTVAGK